MAWLVSAAGSSNGTKHPAVAYPVTYQGGTLPLSHEKVVTHFENNELVFVQGHSRISVPVKDITEISYGSAVHRRFGASVLDVIPLVHLGESGTYYVGVTWTGNSRPEGKSSNMEVLFRLSGSEYRDFVTALEEATGKKAVDTNRVPTVVRYDL